MRRYYINNNGVALVSLIVAAIIMLILATVVMNSFKGINAKGLDDINIISTISQLKENYELYQIRAETFTRNYNIENLNWDGESLPQNTAKLENTYIDDDISLILGEIPLKLQNKLVIKNGILYFFNLTSEEMVWMDKCNLPLYAPALFEYTAGTLLADNNIAVTVDNNGYITINGNSGVEKYFIKLTNGIDYANSKNSTGKLQTWVNTEPVIVPSQTKIIHQVQIASGSFTGEQLNLVLRDSTNTAIANCKLAEDLFSVTQTCTNNVLFSYLYIAPYTECNNFKIKPSVEEYTYVTNDNVVPITPETVTYDNLTCTIVDKNTFLFDGKAKTNYYIKLSNGFDIRRNSMPDNEWVKNGSRFLLKGQNILMFAEFFNLSTVTSAEVNMVLRNVDNALAAKIELMKDQKTTSLILDKDCSAIYLYIRKDSEFKNAKIKFYLEILENE